MVRIAYTLQVPATAHAGRWANFEIGTKNCGLKAGNCSNALDNMSLMT